MQDSRAPEVREIRRLLSRQAAKSGIRTLASSTSTLQPACNRPSSYRRKCTSGSPSQTPARATPASSSSARPHGRARHRVDMGCVLAQIDPHPDNAHRTHSRTGDMGFRNPMLAHCGPPKKGVSPSHYSTSLCPPQESGSNTPGRQMSRSLRSPIEIAHHRR